ncbi:MAG: phosphate ABC transporter permease PstA [Chloroflexota bacterium]|nr:phosphate ABC transporter permease PstA [Chloroflexota bacterium]
MAAANDFLDDTHSPDFESNVDQRQQRGTMGKWLFFSSTVIAMIALTLLLFNISNEAAGLIAVQYEIPPSELADRPLEELPKNELVAILRENVSEGLFRRFEREVPFEERSRSDVLELVLERVVSEEVLETWPLTESIFNRSEIEQVVAEAYPDARLRWTSWLDDDFLVEPMSSTAWEAGVRTAILGSLWMVAITMLVAVPIGVGAAIYLEEYATDNAINRVIQANINNLAGVPSIIYGMLGLAIFVRALEPLTSGAMFGIEGNNGRTILAASLTMALLVLPIIIISAQEAIRAVPNSLRLASYGLGATKWQTIWHHVLPVALPSILTGTILALSRAIGETAPLIVVGASTFIVSDPEGPFSNFTVLPIQIYNWTSRPQDEFRNIAAAAIIVLLALLLTLNATAILLRNRYSREL